MPGQPPDEIVVDLENRLDAVTLQIAAMPDNLETAELMASSRPPKRRGHHRPRRFLHASAQLSPISQLTS
jgi:hypothetical protein